MIGGYAIVERGIDQIRGNAKQKTVLRFLSLAGCVNVLYFALYMVPTDVLIHSSSNNWPADIRTRSYFTSHMCSVGTGYARPSSNVPIPHTNSAHVDENGNLVPGE